MPHGEGIRVGQPWGALSQAEALRLARDPDTAPLHVRVFFAAVGTANTIGHATFEAGQLADLLPRRDGTQPHRTHLANAIRRAVHTGLLLPGSGVRCLLPAAELWDRAGGRGTRTCTWHGIGRSTRPARPGRDPPPAATARDRATTASHPNPTQKGITP